MSIAQNFGTTKPSLLLDFANTKQLDSRITYTRASTASFYNGVTTAKAEENLLQQSQTLDISPWSLSGATILANNTTAPDGTSTAEKLVESSATEAHTSIQNITLPSAVYTFSWYAKAAGRSWVHTRGSVGGQTYFDVTNGVVGTVVAGATASITFVGNGWYRCTVTATAAVTSVQIACGSADNTDSTAGDGTSGIFIWGAQLEQRSAVTAYTATTTQAITNYIPALQSAASGVARFDNNPTTGESLGLLIEESRTNLILQSYDFTTTWTTTNATVTANTVVAPDGTLTGDSIINTATSNQHYALQNVSIAANGTYTTSVYLKALGTTTVATIWLANAATGDRALVYFTFATGVVSSSSAGGTPFTSVSATATSVGNGWSRITLTATSTGGAINLQTRIFPNDASTFTGDAYSGVFAWGAQLEVGTFATSYIPTVASQVTRAADAASMTGTNFSTWFNAGEGMFYSEGQLNYNPIGGGGTEWFSASDGTQSNKIAPYFSTGSGILFSNIVTSGVEQANTGATVISANVNFKYASVYKVNDFASVVNSGTASTDASGVVPYRLSQLVIGDGSSVGNRSRYYKKLAFYPLRVTNAQLQALTS